MTERTEPATIVADVADRIDKVLARAFPDAGRRQLARMFDDGAVRVRGKRAAKGDRVAVGDAIELAYRPAAGDDLRPVADAEAAARLDVLVELPELVVVAKPAGMPAQPLRAGERGTAANGIAARWPECAAVVAGAGDARDGGLVHRLDVGTSGALAAARTAAAYAELRAAFARGAVDKHYLAIACGRPAARSCEAALAQRGDHVVADTADGLPAHTDFVVERSSATHALVRCIARTGRMHQVRAHLALAGAPIAGDVRYGGTPLSGDDGFFLHAARLALPAITGGNAVVVDAPLPERFARALAAVGL
jgi:23S rRNA pseudouridine1911/1915/1917 synthase